MFYKSKPIIVSALLSLAAFNVQSTVVEIQTPEGTIEVNLFDQTTPKTVENFLSYVNSGAYHNNVIHRSDPGFVIQAGGFTYTGPIASINELASIPTGNAVVNEPKLSNLRGTIAMAKQPGNPNSATSGWFINLSNNSANLDIQNGGFTVFGQVMGDGMQVVDAIANLDPLPGSNVPLRSSIQGDITDDNLVVIADIVVTDPTVNSSANLQPVSNTLINRQNSSTDSGSGGSLSWMLLAGCLLLSRQLARTYSD